MAYLNFRREFPPCLTHPLPADDRSFLQAEQDGEDGVEVVGEDGWRDQERGGEVQWGLRSKSTRSDMHAAAKPHIRGAFSAVGKSCLCQGEV